jgi:ureidoglycolate lyase
MAASADCGCTRWSACDGIVLVIELTPIPLTASDFAPYGEVIELEKAEQLSINQGLTTRYHDLVDIDASDQGGRAMISVFRTSPLPLPHQVKTMERHPLGSQAFLPMDQDPFLVLVGNPGSNLSAGDLTLFITNGHQGINFHKNTWHHFQIVTDSQRDFIVVDRGGPGNNLEEIAVNDEVVILANNASGDVSAKTIDNQ